jgi:hypothetical protein
LNNLFRLRAEIADSIPDLFRRIAHDILASLMIHRPLPMQMAFRRLPASKQIREPKRSIRDHPISKKSFGDRSLGTNSP